MIPADYIFQVVSKVDLIGLVEESLNLKKAGAEFRALCPFHLEKTPSFYCNPTKQLYLCRGCGAAGDVVSWMMNYHRESFPNAIRLLAQRAGMPPPPEDQEAVERAARNEPLYAALKSAHHFYRGQLLNNSEVLEYLDSRGVNKIAAERYQLGYAPSRYQIPGINRSVGIDSGLVWSSDGKVGWRLRDRLIFPIRNHQGAVAAFGGREMHKTAPGRKYLNTSETAVYVKGHFLYGIGDLSPNAAKICIHEGYMDSLICNMHGIPSYAICGSNMTGEQADLVLSRHAEVILMFDGDEAGLKATYKALEVLLPRVRPRHVVRVVRLPEGLDPDEYLLASGADAMASLRDTAPLATDWIFRGLESATLQDRVVLIEWIKGVAANLTGSFGDAFAMEVKQRGINLNRKVSIPTAVIRQDYHSLALAMKMTAIVLNKPDFVRRSTFSVVLMPEPVRTLARVIRSKPDATAASVIAMLTPDWQKGVKPAADVQIPELSDLDCEAIYLETALEKAEGEWRANQSSDALALCDVLRDRLERLDEAELEDPLLPDVIEDFDPSVMIRSAGTLDDDDLHDDQLATGT